MAIVEKTTVFKSIQYQIKHFLISKNVLIDIKERTYRYQRTYLSISKNILIDIKEHTYRYHKPIYSISVKAFFIGEKVTDNVRTI